MQSHPLHATGVCFENKAVLLMGPSGSGKSDLALRLIEGGASLIGDDQLVLQRNAETLRVSPAANLQGMLEARGVGILHLPYVQDIPLTLVVMLVPRNEVERLPEPTFFDCLGLQVPLLSLHAFECSTPAKIRFSLHNL